MVVLAQNKRSSRNMERSEKIVLTLDIGGSKIRTGRKEFRTPKNRKSFVSLLKKFDFQKIFPKAVLRVDNDARVFLRERAKKVRAKRILTFTIGTGIGRAYAEKGRVKKIKNFEYPEKWEREYQKIRDRKDYEKLAMFLGEKFSVLIKKYKPEAVVLGGGVLGKRGFFEKLREELKIKTYV